MIRIAFIGSPLISGHKVRGVGYYTKNLLAKLKERASENGLDILEVADSSQLEILKYDVLHYPFFDLFQHTLPMSDKGKIVVTIHDVIPLEFPDHYPLGLKGKLNLFFQKLALKQVDAIITDSKASSQNIQKYLEIDPKRIKVVYLAANAGISRVTNKATLLEVKKKFNLPTKFVLYVGDVNYNKNIPNLLAACKKINIPLVMVGKQSANLENLDLTHPELRHLTPHKADLIAYAQRLGFLSDEDLSAVYTLASVCCQPSLAEGFGLPVLEAMACGTQVACSKTSSLPEIAGSAATYFDPENVDEIASSIKQSLTSKFDVQSQAAKFTWDKTAAETIKVYKSI